MPVQPVPSARRALARGRACVALAPSRLQGFRMGRTCSAALRPDRPGEAQVQAILCMSSAWQACARQGMRAAALAAC